MITGSKHASEPPPPPFCAALADALTSSLVALADQGALCDRAVGEIGALVRWRQAREETAQAAGATPGLFQVRPPPKRW